MSKFYAHAIKVVSQFATTDRTLALLATLHVEPFDGYVIVKATDRYTLATYKIVDDLATTDTPAFLLDPKIGKALSAQHGDFLTLEHLSAAKSEIEVESYPVIDRLIPSADTLGAADGVTSVLFNGDFLARFKSSVLGRDKYTKKAPVTIEFNTPTKPALVAFGATSENDWTPYFRALIIPLRPNPDAPVPANGF